MDSDNSGSLHSSSAGEEECDSSYANVAPIYNSSPSLIFDQFSGFLPLYPNTAFPGTASLRSEPNPAFHDVINLPFTAPFQLPTESGNRVSNQPLAARNPRKRSRASRRAPTTVLTTDTTNFRAMVQEFTGIPSPPFSNPSLTRNRLDLFGNRSSAFEPPLIRRTASSVANHQFPIAQSNPNIFNIQNPILTSLLQTNPKFLPNSPITASKPYTQNSFEIPPNGEKIDEFAIASGDQVNHFTNLISNDQIEAQNNGDPDEEGGGLRAPNSGKPASLSDFHNGKHC